MDNLDELHWTQDSGRGQNFSISLTQVPKAEETR